MEHKAWLWRKKTSEKAAYANDKNDVSLGNLEQAVKTEEIERSLRSLHEKLASALTESTAKDDLLAKYISVAEEALEGWERAEVEASSLKEELDDALQFKFTAEEKIADLETALGECKQQLHVSREEQKQMASDAAMEAVREKKKIKVLEEKLVELNGCLSKLSIENSNLIQVLEIKENVIVDLNEHSNQAYTKINAMIAMLESLEKSNSSLKYQVYMLEKELQVRNDEKEFNLKSVDAAHRQHLESVKKITKLESECQRLRVMVRRRLPGPAALAKMRSEVEMLGKDTYEMRKKMPNVTRRLLARDFAAETYSDSSNRRASLIEQLNATENENKILKETITKKNSELQSARVMCAHTASKLSHAETKLEEISKGYTKFQCNMTKTTLHDMPYISACENGVNKDHVSCAESWASALISQLENFRNGRTPTVSTKSSVVSELSLMDDFLDMERLAIVCMDEPFVHSTSLSDINNTSPSSHEIDLKLDVSLEKNSKSNTEVQSSTVSLEKSSKWLQDAVSAILQWSHVSKRSLDSILEEISVNLVNKGYLIVVHPCGGLHAIQDYPQKTQHSSLNLVDEEYGTDLPVGQTTTDQSIFMFNKFLHKLINLIEEICEKLLTHNSATLAVSKNDKHTTPGSKLSYAGHLSHIVHWNTAELTSVLQCFIQTCNDVLSKETKPEMFFQHLISTMDWIFNHCFYPQEFSSIEDTIKKLDLHEPIVGENCECQGKYVTEISLTPTVCNNSVKLIASHFHESRSLRNDAMRFNNLKEMKVAKRKEIFECKSLVEQLGESEKGVLNLKAELATLKESKRIIEEQIEHQRLQNVENETQLSAAKVELKEVHQKFSSLEITHGDKTNCCEELGATCLDLELQLKSASIRESSHSTVNQDQKQLRSNWEISAASEKIAECQDTILNLGRQLKALASPSDVPLFEKVISKPKEVKVSRRALLDQMMAEDEERLELGSQKETVSIPQRRVSDTPNNPNVGLLYGRNILPNPYTHNFPEGGLLASPVKISNKLHSSYETKKCKETDVGALTIVPKKHKTNLNLLRKILSRGRKDNKKLTVHALSY